MRTRGLKENRHRRRWIRTASCALSSALVVGACGSSSKPAASSSPTTSSGIGRGIDRGVAAIARRVTSLRTQYPSVAGHHFVIGLAGFTAGFEAPEANDPSKIVGIDPDLFTYLGQCLGFTYDLQNSTYSALIPALESGRVAMGPSLYVTTSRSRR